MRVHVVQLAYDDTEPVAERVDRVAALVRGQRGADLVVLPELWAHGGFASRHWAERAEPVDGPTVTSIAAAARDLGATVHAGSIVERAGDDLFNTSVLLAPDGTVAATYRKIHRFGFDAGEPLIMSAGSDVVVAPLPALGVTLGLATCYDLRFPELFRRLLDAGADTLVAPAAWPAARVDHWTLLGRARAVENQCAAILANTAGTHARTPMGGRSQVVAADGRVLAEAGDAEEVLVAEVDPAETARYRQEFPVLRDRRL
ncbi:MAG: carbon-nitrogen family hydrolase [Kineosporiaceae bacterium]